MQNLLFHRDYKTTNLKKNTCQEQSYWQGNNCAGRETASFIKIQASKRSSVIYAPPFTDETKTATYSFSGCRRMGSSPPGFPLGRACRGRDARLRLGEGSACGAGGSASSPTRCCSFMFSQAGNPRCSPDNRESGPRSTTIINATAAGSPTCLSYLCSHAVGRAVVHEGPVWKCLEVTDSLPVCSRRGLGCSRAVGAGDPCSQGDGQPGAQRGRRDLRRAVLPTWHCAGPPLGEPSDHPHGTYSALPAFWGLCVQV